MCENILTRDAEEEKILITALVLMHLKRSWGKIGVIDEWNNK